MDPPALVGQCRAVDGRANEGMTKRQMPSVADESLVLGGLGVVRGEVEPAGGAPEQVGIRSRLGSEQQEQCLRRGRQASDPPQEALLQPSPDRQRLGECRNPSELRRRQLHRKLDQRQRIAAGLGDDTALHSAVYCKTAQDDGRLAPLRAVSSK